MKKLTALLAVPLLLLSCQGLASAQVFGTTPMWNALNQVAEQRVIKLNEDLFKAIIAGNLPAVKELLKKGADVNVRTRKRPGDPTTELIWDTTPLMVATWYGRTEIVRLLLDNGANVNAQNMRGDTALMEAALYDCTEIVRLLLSKGANVNAQNMHGDTALMNAASLGHTGVVRLLLNKGANVNAQNRFGNTALIDAAWHGRTEVVRLLLSKGANVNIRAYDNNTALSLATDQGHTEIIRLLKQHGAK